MDSKRFVFIDYCKTMAIMLVFLGHYGSVSKIATDIIFSFHMPLFFFCSGFLFKRYNWITQLEKLRKSIIMPLFFFILFSYITLYAPRNIIHHNYTDIFSFIHVMFIIPIIDTIRGLGVCDNGSLWFIYSLILCIITFRLLPEKIIYYLKKYFYIFLLVIPLFSMAWNSIFTENLPWNIQRHFIICCFFILGYNLKYYIFNVDLNCIKDKILCIILILSFSLYLIIYLNSFEILSWDNYSLSIPSSYQTFILTLLGIIFAIVLSIFFAKLFGRNKYIEFISNNTYTLFATEFVWQWNLHRVELITNLEFTPLLMVISRFILSIIFAYFINKYFPFLIGKKKCYSVKK